MLRRRRHLHRLTLRNFRLRTAKRLVYGAIVTEYIIVRLVCDMAQTQHETQGRVLCLSHIAHTKRTITITYIYKSGLTYLDKR